MKKRVLEGKRIAVLVENLYIPEEVESYQQRFGELGAKVEFMSDLWGESAAVFVSDIDGIDDRRRPNKPLQMLFVHTNFKHVQVEDYAAVLMAANYCSVRLRYFVPSAGSTVSAYGARNAPAVEFFAKAMASPHIVKGALCHGLWILTPRPELLKGRRVTCHEVVIADVSNAGAVYENSENGVVVDADLVTGHSIKEVGPYVEAISQQIQIFAGKQERVEAAIDRISDQIKELVGRNAGVFNGPNEGGDEDE